MYTLDEHLKLRPDPLTAGVVEIFQRSSGLLEVLPFESIGGTAYQYARETSLGNVDFRAINGQYSESTGTVTRYTEPLAIAGGDSDVDVFLLNAGTDRATYDAMKFKALARFFEKHAFSGDKAVTPNGFDGLVKRISAGQKIDADADPLTQDALDQLIDLVPEANALFMSAAARRKLSALARSSAQISYGPDLFGNPQMLYAGVPVRVIGKDPSGAAIVSDAAIYACRLGGDGLHGIQQEPISARDLGELQTKPAVRSRVDWAASIVLKRDDAAAELSNFT